MAAWYRWTIPVLAVALLGCGRHGSAKGLLCNSGACGGQWASWPMPNPASAGLPNPASYDTSAPDVVIDKVTGLMWQSAVDKRGAITWVDGDAYCAHLTAGGHSDWRLPTEIELLSIVDYTKSEPAIDTDAFGLTPSASFWSSSTLVGAPSFARDVDFEYGFAGNRKKSEWNMVRCVR